MQSNSAVIEQISKWLAETHEKVRKNVNEKETLESVNEHLYSYLHDIFGADVINIFDLKFDEIYAGKKDDSQ